MKKLVLLTLIISFSVSNLIYAQEINYDKIEKNKKERKDVFSGNSSNNSQNKKTQRKKALISGTSTFMWEKETTKENVFENDDFRVTSSSSFFASVGGFLTNNFVLGASFLISSSTFSPSSETVTTTVIGPFIRGYAKNFYSQVGYALNKKVNESTVGIGNQIFINESKSVSLNPTLFYYIRDDKNSDIQKNGILIGFSFEVHL